MSMHWTYEDVELESDLYQGDILSPTDELRSLLRDVHPHFLDPKYTAFMIVTQTCDMAIRKGAINSNTKYINIAVVRPLTAVINDFLSSLIDPISNGVYPQEKKFNARMLLERIFNQNEQALGLFYLHPDAVVGIGEPSISLIRVTFTLRVQHYEVLRKSRRGRLKSEFRSKFGWLVGNLYARVGTEDWSKPPERKKELEKLINEHLDHSPDCVWVKSALAEEARTQGVKLEDIKVGDIDGVLRKYEQPPTIDKAIDRIQTVINSVCSTIEPDELRRISGRLRNDPIFAGTIKKA